MTRLLVLLASTSAMLSAAEVQTAQPSDFTVHEWGTFTSVAGQDGSPVDWDALGGVDDLPRFVNDFGYRCFKWSLTGTVRMETPVLYFYSPQALEAHVKISFPKGLITEWYPQAQYEVFEKSNSDGAMHRMDNKEPYGIDTSLRSVTGSIEWPSVHVEPNTFPPLPTETAPSRYYAARQTESAPITVGEEHEKFLFYRGVGRFPVPLSARIANDGSIALENHGAEAVPTVILFENHEGHLGFHNVGAVRGAATLDLPSLDSSLPALREELEAALTAQGLFPKEAQAMVETWRDSWFEEGTRLIYIVPSRAVDAFLPLHVDPAPSQSARVFVGRIELITPEATRSVEEAIAKGDWQALQRYGRFLGPILDRIVAERPSMKDPVEQVRQKIASSIAGGACR
jgi:hypothetical protein